MFIVVGALTLTAVVTVAGAVTGLLTAVAGVAVALRAFKDQGASSLSDKATNTLLETIGRVDGERDDAVARAEKAEAAAEAAEAALAECQEHYRELHARLSGK